MSHSTLCHGILYSRPAPIEYNQATLRLISLCGWYYYLWMHRGFKCPA